MTCCHTKKLDRQGRGRAHIKQKKKYSSASFPVKESLETSMLHFSVSYKHAQLLSLPWSMWAAFQMRKCGKAQCLSFMLDREVSQMSETDNWEQGQRILGIWDEVWFLGNYAKEIFIGLLGKVYWMCSK